MGPEASKGEDQIRRKMMGEKKVICQNCQHFNMQSECEIVKKKKNPLLTACQFYRERTSLIDWRSDKK